LIFALGLQIESPIAIEEKGGRGDVSYVVKFKVTLAPDSNQDGIEFAFEFEFELDT